MDVQYEMSFQACTQSHCTLWQSWGANLSEAQATALSLNTGFFFCNGYCQSVWYPSFIWKRFIPSKNFPFRETAFLILVRKDKYGFEIFLSLLSKIRCSGTKNNCVSCQTSLCWAEEHSAEFISSPGLCHAGASPCPRPSLPHRPHLPPQWSTMCPSPRPSPTCLLGWKLSQIRDHTVCRSFCNSCGLGHIVALCYPKWKEELVQSACAGEVGSCVMEGADIWPSCCLSMFLQVFCRTCRVLVELWLNIILKKELIAYVF